MKPGDLIKFQSGVAIWDVKSSPSSVIGRTDDRICVVLEEEHDEVKVLCPDGLVGWVSKRVMKEFNRETG